RSPGRLLTRQKKTHSPVCSSVLKNTHTLIWASYTHVHKCTCAHSAVFRHTHIYCGVIHTCSQMHMRSLRSLHTHTHTHTHTHMQTNTNTHTHRLTHTEREIESINAQWFAQLRSEAHTVALHAALPISHTHTHTHTHTCKLTQTHTHTDLHTQREKEREREREREKRERRGGRERDIE